MKIRVGVIGNRHIQILLGIGFFILGSFLLYDAYDRQGRKMKWPVGGIMPF